MSKADREFALRNSASDIDFLKSSGVRSDMDKFEPSLTRQEFAEECDINSIMARYEQTGVVSHVNHAVPQYLDTTMYSNLQASMDAFKEAELAFLALPAAVRKEFDNDPQKFVLAAQDEKYADRFREWGLREPEPVAPAPIAVSVVNPPAPPAGAPAGSVKPA